MSETEKLHAQILADARLIHKSYGVKVEKMLLAKHISMGEFRDPDGPESTKKMLLLLMQTNFKITGIPEFITTDYLFWLHAVETKAQYLKYVPRVFMTDKLFLIACDTNPIIAIQLFPKELVNFVNQKTWYTIFKTCPILRVLRLIPDQARTLAFYQKAAQEIPVFGCNFQPHRKKMRVSFRYGANIKDTVHDIRNTMKSFKIPMLQKGEGSGKNGRILKKDLVYMITQYMPKHVNLLSYPFYGYV